MRKLMKYTRNELILCDYFWPNPLLIHDNHNFSVVKYCLTHGRSSPGCEACYVLLNVIPLLVLGLLQNVKRVQYFSMLKQYYSLNAADSML